MGFMPPAEGARKGCARHYCSGATTLASIVILNLGRFVDAAAHPPDTDVSRQWLAAEIMQKKNQLCPLIKHNGCWGSHKRVGFPAWACLAW